MKLVWVVLTFDKIKNCDHHNLTAKHVILGAEGLLDVDGIKIFDKDNQAAKAAKHYFIVLWPGHLYDPINIRRPIFVYIMNWYIFVYITNWYIFVYITNYIYSNDCSPFH